MCAGSRSSRRRSARGLAAIHAVVEAAPARLAQAQHGVVGRAVADEPDAIAIRRKGIHELIEQRLEIENGSDDGVRPDRHDLPRAGRQRGREIDGQMSILFGRGRRDVPAAHVQAQDEIERVRVDDQIGETVDQQRKARGLEIGRGQGNPSRQQRADAERREQAPGRIDLHAVATARAAVALRDLRQARFELGAHFVLCRDRRCRARP